jgi:hypothetical protein
MARLQWPSTAIHTEWVELCKGRRVEALGLEFSNLLQEGQASCTLHALGRENRELSLERRSEEYEGRTSAWSLEAWVSSGVAEQLELSVGQTTASGRSLPLCRPAACPRTTAASP